MARSENNKSKKEQSDDSSSKNEANTSDLEEKVLSEKSESEEESLDSSDDEGAKRKEDIDEGVDDEESEEEDDEDVDDDDDDDDDDEDEDDDVDDEDDDVDDEDDDDDEDEDVPGEDKPLVNNSSEQVTSVKVAQKPFNFKAASLVFIVMATLSVMAANTFYDQGILLIAGIFLFLGAYPAIKLDVKDPTKKFSIEMALIFALCMIIFVVLRTLFPENTDDKDHAKIVIIILTMMAARLIVWPIYTFSDEE